MLQPFMLHDPVSLRCCGRRLLLFRTVTNGVVTAEQREVHCSALVSTSKLLSGNGRVGRQNSQADSQARNNNHSGRGRS
jgi:hypothetical protein